MNAPNIIFIYFQFNSRDFARKINSPLRDNKFPVSFDIDI